MLRVEIHFFSPSLPPFHPLEILPLQNNWLKVAELVVEMTSAFSVLTTATEGKLIRKKDVGIFLLALQLTMIAMGLFIGSLCIRKSTSEIFAAFRRRKLRKACSQLSLLLGQEEIETSLRHKFIFKPKVKKGNGANNNDNDDDDDDDEGLVTAASIGIMQFNPDDDDPSFLSAGLYSGGVTEQDYGPHNISGRGAGIDMTPGFRSPFRGSAQVFPSEMFSPSRLSSDPFGIAPMPMMSPLPYPPSQYPLVTPQERPIGFSPIGFNTSLQQTPLSHVPSQVPSAPPRLLNDHRPPPLTGWMLSSPHDPAPFHPLVSPAALPASPFSPGDNSHNFLPRVFGIGNSPAGKTEGDGRRPALSSITDKKSTEAELKADGDLDSAESSTGDEDEENGGVLGDGDSNQIADEDVEQQAQDLEVAEVRVTVNDDDDDDDVGAEMDQEHEMQDPENAQLRVSVTDEKVEAIAKKNSLKRRSSMFSFRRKSNVGGVFTSDEITMAYKTAFALLPPTTVISVTLLLIFILRVQKAKISQRRKLTKQSQMTFSPRDDIHFSPFFISLPSDEAERLEMRLGSGSNRIANNTSNANNGGGHNGSSGDDNEGHNNDDEKDSDSCNSIFQGGVLPGSSEENQ